MTRVRRGSQTRESIRDAGLRLIKLDLTRGYAVVEDPVSGVQSVWHRNDYFAGYVLVINGIGYEFARSIN